MYLTDTMKYAKIIHILTYFVINLVKNVSTSLILSNFTYISCKKYIFTNIIYKKYIYSKITIKINVNIL